MLKKNLFPHNHFPACSVAEDLGATETGRMYWERIPACQQCPLLRSSALGGCCFHPSHCSSALCISPDPQPHTQGSWCCRSCHNPPCFSGCIRPTVSGCGGRTFLWLHIPCRVNPQGNAPACTATRSCDVCWPGQRHSRACTGLAWARPGPTGPRAGSQLQQALSRLLLPETLLKLRYAHSEV